MARPGEPATRSLRLHCLDSNRKAPRAAFVQTRGQRSRKCLTASANYAHTTADKNLRATVMYGPGDVRVENVPDARLKEPTDALLRITHACICGSDLWPYKTMEPTNEGRRMGHEFIGVVEAIGK